MLPAAAALSGPLPSFPVLSSTIVFAGLARAIACGDTGTDYRAALCRWEDSLFAEFPAGHEIIELDEAVAMIGEVFRAFGKRAPSLELVPGFDDPKVGGYADVAGYRIAIESGFLYRFLVLHECAHLLVPEDRNHGPAFIYVLQILYRCFIGIPERAVARHLRRHGLPSYTSLPDLALAS